MCVVRVVAIRTRLHRVEFRTGSTRAPCVGQKLNRNKYLIIAVIIYNALSTKHLIPFHVDGFSGEAFYLGLATGATHPLTPWT